MKKQERNKPMQGGFAGIPRYVIETKAYKSLKFSSQSLLLLMSYQYKGRNNGDISASYSMYKEYFKSNQTLFNARDELERNGFIAVNAYGGMSYGGFKLPTLYALTWLPVNDFFDQNKNLFRCTHLPIGKELKYFLNGVNPKYKKPKQKKTQYKKDLKNPNVKHDKN
jgi:hypothetical protein